MPAARNFARCCDSADCVSPMASTSVPTERSPSISSHRIASRCSLASAVRSRAASAALALSSRASLSCNDKVVTPSAQRRFGVLEFHRNGEIAHAVDMGGREFPGANVDLDRRQQQPRRRQGCIARLAHLHESILGDAFLHVHVLLTLFLYSRLPRI